MLRSKIPSFFTLSIRIRSILSGILEALTKTKKEKNHGRLDKDREEFRELLRSIHGGD